MSLDRPAAVNDHAPENRGNAVPLVENAAPQPVIASHGEIVSSPHAVDLVRRVQKARQLRQSVVVPLKVSHAEIAVVAVRVVRQRRVPMPLPPKAVFKMFPHGKRRSVS